MSAEQKMENVERESLKDLKVLVEKSKEWAIDMVVIGSYAVRALPMHIDIPKISIWQYQKR